MIEEFVDDHLSNWYVRLNRKRFWGKEMDGDKLSAYQTLYTCLVTMAKLLAPSLPSMPTGSILTSHSERIGRGRQRPPHPLPRG